MSYDSLFNIANGIALASWIILLLFPFHSFTNRLLVGVTVMILCLAYSILVYNIMVPQDFNKFRSLSGVASLLSVPAAALAGWIHYLAFDLMAGLFVAHNAAKHGISHAWIIPCLLLTFMLGPVGLLLYFLIRWSLTKHYFATNY